LRRASKNLEEAKKYSANIMQSKMIGLYIDHFNSGDIELHKESQRAWVRDVKPVIETNIGFIEYKQC